MTKLTFRSTSVLDVPTNITDLAHIVTVSMFVTFMFVTASVFVRFQGHEGWGLDGEAASFLFTVICSLTVVQILNDHKD